MDKSLKIVTIRIVEITYINKTLLNLKLAQLPDASDWIGTLYELCDESLLKEI